LQFFKESLLAGCIGSLKYPKLKQINCQTLKETRFIKRLNLAIFQAQMLQLSD
jgi:hypothetical protein